MSKAASVSISSLLVSTVTVSIGLVRLHRSTSYLVGVS